jgi:Flp pilus assembly protein TadD
MSKSGARRNTIKDSAPRAAPAVSRRRSGNKASSSAGRSKPALTAAQLYERAQQAVAFERYDAALECMRDALALEPENIDVLDALGALLAELGRTEEAVQARAVACQPPPTSHDAANMDLPVKHCAVAQTRPRFTHH